jgi:hypothetical protein
MILHFKDTKKCMISRPWHSKYVQRFFWSFEIILYDTTQVIICYRSFEYHVDDYGKCKQNIEKVRCLHINSKINP